MNFGAAVVEEEEEEANPESRSISRLSGSELLSALAVTDAESSGDEEAGEDEEE